MISKQIHNDRYHPNWKWSSVNLTRCMRVTFWQSNHGLELDQWEGGGGRALVVQLQDMNTVHGRTVFWTMLCVLVLGSTSVDVPLIFTQEWEINDPRLIKIKVNAVYFFVCITLCNFDKSLTSVKFFLGGGCFEKNLFEQLFWCSELNCLHFYLRNMLFSVQFTQMNTSIYLVWITFQWHEPFVLENSSVCLTVWSDKRFSLMSSSVCLTV